MAKTLYRKFREGPYEKKKTRLAGSKSNRGLTEYEG
jgi:hypothetical protein